MTFKRNGCYAGLDVGKQWLDLAIHDVDGTRQFSNSPAGVKKLIIHLSRLDPALVVVEATGGYEQLIVQAMFSAGIPVHVANPTRIRSYARAKGVLAKTDTIDAVIITEYGYMLNPEPQNAKSEEEIRLRSMIMRREQLVEIRAAESNRLHTVHLCMKSSVEDHLRWLSGQIEELDVQIQALIHALPAVQASVNLLKGIPGVGPITAATVQAEMPELGQVNRQQIAALAGLAPYNRDSGKKRGRRRIFGGRKSVRRVLYMACISGIRHNPVIRKMYEQKIAEGKPFKVAITACMRKLLVIMNAMVRDGTAWSYT